MVKRYNLEDLEISENTQQIPSQFLKVLGLSMFEKVVFCLYKKSRDIQFNMILNRVKKKYKYTVKIYPYLRALIS